MCIRDSVFPLSNWTELDIWRYIEREKLEVPSIYFSHERQAVSYTHLRAHETVLDLVCRLLLENKNTSEHHVLATQQSLASQMEYIPL